MTKRHEIYSNITAQLIAAIEAGAGNWHMPWHHDGTAVMRPHSALGRPYHGINRLVLWASAEARGYASGRWATFRQWQGLDGRVRKGEKATRIVFWKKQETDKAGTADNDNDAGNDEDHTGARFILRAFSVFNEAQIDGLAASAPTERLDPAPSVAATRAFLERCAVSVTWGLYDAHYRLSEDRIYMPEATAFESDIAMIGTLAHEICHASGHASRLARTSLRDYHKDPAIRAREELLAEIGSSFLLADLSLAATPRRDHAAYIASWLELLKPEPRAMFQAAAGAQAAADWCHAQARAAASPRAA